MSWHIPSQDSKLISRLAFERVKVTCDIGGNEKVFCADLTSFSAQNTSFQKILTELGITKMCG